MTSYPKSYPEGHPTGFFIDAAGIRRYDPRLHTNCRPDYRPYWDTTPVRDPNPGPDAKKQKPASDPDSGSGSDSDSGSDLDLDLDPYASGPSYKEETNTGSDLSSADDDDDPVYSGSPSDWSDEEDRREHAKYNRQIRKYRGFFINFLPRKTSPYGLIRPFDPSRDKPEKPLECTQFAIRKYNEKHGASLELVKVENVTVGTCTPHIYYITFEGKDLSSLDVKTYQTKVWDNIINGKRKVRVFRLKPERKSKK